MKRLVVVIWLAVVALVAVVTGCDRAPRYDSRLVAADSLMQPAPDSALALVQAVAPGSLTGEADSAYRRLLLTQGRYRCYVTATSDSDINCALAYYRRHDGEREKLTRAFIYKGAVMEELGHPDSAMAYYKTAETTAAPDDYFNLGYAKMRIATLYQDQYSLDSAAIIRFRQAIKYFEKLNNTTYLISCCGDYGGLCGINQPDSAEYYLTRAIELAESIHSPQKYTYESTLAGFCYYYNHDYKRSKDLSVDIILNGKDACDETQFYYYAALSYLKLGLLDSAKYILSIIPAPRDAVDSMNLYQVRAEIAHAGQDLIAYSANLAKAKDKQIQILSKKQDDKLKVAEVDFDRLQAEQSQVQTRYHNRRLLIALSIALFLIISLWVFTMQLRRAINRAIEDRKTNEQALTATIKQLEEEQQRLLEKQGTVSQLLAYRIDALNELFESIRFKTVDANKRGAGRSVIPLSSVIKGLSESHHILNVQLSDKFWANLKLSLDGEYRGIATFIENNYTDLTPKERQLLYLQCANVSPQIIKLCMNYNNVNSVYNRLNIIIKKKMGLNMTSDEFINKYLQGSL